MPRDYPGDTWNGATYNGFSGAPPMPPPAAPPRRVSRTALVAGGVVAALVLGLGLGFLTRPHLASQAPAASTPAAPTPLPTPTLRPQLPIEVNPVAPPAPAKPAGRLEVLPPRPAPVAPPREPAQAAAPTPPPPVRPPPQVDVPTPAPLALAPPQPAAPPAPRLRASFDCAAARPGAEQMVCSDPDLAAADRAMARAYRRALDRSDDPAAVRADQRDWMDIREDAARHGRRALAEVYTQRLNELEAAAEGEDDGY